MTERITAAGRFSPMRPQSKKNWIRQFMH